MLGEYALQSLHEILATSFGVNGDRSIVPPDQASAPEETIKQYETAMALQTHPHFSRITPDGRFVECKCASLIVLSGPWDLAKFEEHLVEKQKKKENRAAKRLEADGVPNKQQRKATRTLTKSAAAVRLKKKSFPREIHWDVATARNVFPCPGLRDDKMMAFVDAAVHLTGGARPRHKIAYELFPALFDADKAPSNSKKIAARLSEEEKLLLHDAIEAETLWFIDKDGGSVRSFDCKGVIEVGKGETVCAHCAELRSNVSLRTAVTSKVMKKKQQQPANPLHRKFCSSRVFSVLESEFNMQDEYARVLRDLSLVELADDSALNMWLDMAELGIHGAFDSHATLLGLVESMATLKDKERRGVGMQNMNYNHHLDAFMRSMAEISVDACDFFQHHLCGRKQKILLGRKRSKTLAHQQQQPHNNSSDPDEVLQPSTEELQMLQQHQQLLYEDAASSLHQTDGFAHLLDASNSSMMPNLSMSDIQDVDLSAFTTTATATSSTSVSTHAELSHSMAAEVDGHNSSALEQHGAVDNTGVMTSESPHGTNDHEDEEMEEDEGNDGNSDRFLSQLASSNGSSTRDQSADATTTATPAPQAPPRIPLDHMPCTGLRSEKVENYVKTAVQIIGGSRPKYVIAKELFPQVFQDAKTVKIGEKLNDQQKRVLQDAVFSECLWRVDKVGNCVRSLRCARIAETRAKGVCKPCWDLKTVANFRSVLSRAKVPKNLENVKFMPSMYTESDPFLRKLSKNASFRALYQLVKQRGPEDPKKVTFWLRCARMGVFGNFRTHPVFEGLMESMVEIKDKERRGVGKQNMQYSKPLDDFMNALSAISMEAFEVFASHFCGRTIRSQKVKKRKLSSTIASSLYEAHSDALHATATSSAEGVMVNGLHGAMDDGMHLHQHQHTELLNNNIMDIEQHANQHQQLAEDLLGSRPMSASDLEENQRFMDRMLDEVRLSHDMQLHDDHHHRSSLDNSTALDPRTYLDEEGVLTTEI
uniref:Uncharacterized protein n=1 Tax=Globisporangium ultimum (strain ATCC 200006 / CBS 805.95 / DAOM BR144) TaxID=431595 RepID=K3WEL2_GLOUD